MIIKQLEAIIVETARIRNDDFVEIESDILRKLIEIIKAAKIACGDGCTNTPEGGPSFYTVESRFVRRVKDLICELESL